MTEKKVAVVKRKNEVGKFIEQAIAKGLPVETMKELFLLQKEVKAEQAKEAFVTALAEFQKVCPVIKKTKKVLNKNGTLRYLYAPLEAIIEQIKKPLSESGISYTWKVENKDKLVKAIIKVTHIFGHSETSSFEVPIDSNEYMTLPQRYASSLTFVKRYTLCNALGISTGDEDTDATDVNKEPDTQSKKAKIMLQLRKLGYKTDTKKKIEDEVMNLTKLKLVEKNYDEIIGRLEVKVKEIE